MFGELLKLSCNLNKRRPEIRMETKDYLTIGISLVALLFSMLSIYFAHFHKPSSAVLSLIDRNYSAELIVAGEVVSKSKRHIYYCLCNTGRQSLYVKEVSMLRGPSRLGNLRDSRSYFVLKHKDKIKPFVIEPGEVVPFELTHDMDYSSSLKIVPGINDYELVSLEVISANGKRYQMCHDITRLPTHGLEVEDPLFDGVSLGKPVHSIWYI